MSTETPYAKSYFPAATSLPVAELTVGGLLERRAWDAAGQTALVEVAPAGSASLCGAARTDRRWTYAALYAEAEHCACWLLRYFAPGDRITVWAPNIPEWVILEYGAALAGLVLVTANPALRKDELAYVMGQSRSAGLFHAAAFRGTDMSAIASAAVADLPRRPRLFSFADWEEQVRRSPRGEGALPEVRPDDPVQIQYTSGTTGMPKGALLHHKGLVNNADFYTRRGQFPDGGVVVSAMPLFHTAGSAMSVLGCAQRKATYGLVQAFDPALVLGATQALRANVVTGVPTMLIAMLNDPAFSSYDLSSCAVVVSGGASVPPELVDRIERSFDCRFSTVYGQTELSPVVTQTSPDDGAADRAETVGRPLWQVEMKVADVATGEPLPVGEQGEICARGYQKMLGYFDMPEATAQTIDNEGWLHTGDLGTMDSRGFFRVTGRLKDMIIRGGENIYPRETETLLFTHPTIVDVAVVGVPDETWGEQVAAVLRIRQDVEAPTPEDLHNFCRAHLAPHKTPRFWYLATEFPLTGSGKVQKFRIVEFIQQGRYRLLDVD